jgi:osmotically-inducible protein OsmY
MKPKLLYQEIGRWAPLPLLVIGSANFLYATPQAAPSGDIEIARFIQMDMSADKRMQGADIKVRVEKNIAALTGDVRSLAQAERATARAIASDGVDAVLNQTMISPAPRIAENAKEALRGQKMFRPDGIVVSVKGARISLSGSAGTPDEKELAREVISEVPGVVAVDNNINVTYEGIREDSQIAEQLRFLIKDDPLCEGLDLAVSVKSGTVSLSGQVGSRSEYDRLIRRSYVTGVMEVRTAKLSVETDLAMEGLVDKDYSKEQSLQAFHAVMDADNRVDPSTVRAALDDGVMTLKGSVNSIATRDVVESTARGIPGVLRVSDELKISDGGGAVASRQFAVASPPLVIPSR